MIAPVTIVIPHYNDLENLKACLESLFNQEGVDFPVDIIVADNNSSVDLSEIDLLLAGRGRRIDVPQRGAWAARNAGADAAEGTILAFIDSDCVADRRWLANAVAALDEADIVTGRVDVFVKDPAAPTPSEAFEQVFAFDNRRYVEQEGFAVTASLVMRKSAFERIGGFRPFVAEDKEWCQRAVRNGFSLRYFDEVAIAHPARASLSELIRKWSRLGEQSYFLARDTSGVWRWWARSLLLPASILPAGGRVLASPKLKGLRSRLGAIGVLSAIRLYRFGHAQVLMVSAPSAGD